MTLIEYLEAGLVIGAIYAMVSLGFSFLYSTAKVLNFAHGQMYMIGAFAAYAIIRGVGARGWHIGGFGIAGPVLGLLAAAAVGGAAGLLANALVFRPLRRADPLIQAISSFGLTIAITNVALLWAGPDDKQAPGMWPGDGFHILGARVTYVALGLVLFVLACPLVFDRLLNRTLFGKVTKAVGQDAEVSSLLGIATERAFAVSFFTVSLLGGVSGFLITYYYGTVSFNMGFDAAVSGFTAAILGGLGSVRGAVLGGLILGIVTAFAQGYVGGAWNGAVPLVVLIAVLVVRPAGILGRSEQAVS
jgi:branched-chain amino acid transport system permease protein